MNWKQFLTEKVLHEPEAASEYTVANNGDLVSVKTVIKNRTYDNRDDLMDLYAAIEKAGRWRNFEGETFDYWDEERIHDTTNSAFTAWLFCLDGEDYESRCCLVAQWLEGKR